MPAPSLFHPQDTTPAHAPSIAFRPLALREANAAVAAWHRHSKPVQGAKFAIGLDRGGILIGAVIVGRPVARSLDDGYTAEVTRLVLDPSAAGKNHASMLYGAARRAARAMGYRSVITYTLESETGASLVAAGFRRAADVRGREWSCRSRPRQLRLMNPGRVRWES